MNINILFILSKQKITININTNHMWSDFIYPDEVSKPIIPYNKVNNKKK